MTQTIENRGKRLAYQRDYYAKHREQMQVDWREMFAMYKALGFHRVRRNGRMVWVSPNEYSDTRGGCRQKKTFDIVVKNVY